MILSVSLDLAFGSGLDRREWAAAMEEARTVLDGLKRAYADRSLELLRLPEQRDDIEAARKAVAGWASNTSDVVVLGIGGSSLGAQALAELRGAFAPPHTPRVHVFENADPVTFAAALERLDLRATRFVAVSKSGSTAETLVQTLGAARAIEAGGGGKYLSQHFIIVTEPRHSPLRAFAESIGCPILDHPTGIGGRYAVLTVVGLLSAILLGLDPEALRAGAADVVRGMLDAASPTDVPACVGAALHHALARRNALTASVLWSYSDRLKTFGPWWRQLWAESLGKDGKGCTPVAALGPVDQHSQLQLFLDGPGQMLFTLITTDTAHAGPVTDATRARALGVDYLAGKTLGDLVAAEARATAETLARRGRPVRRMHVPQIDERAMGTLLMHFMLETIVTGRLMGVDPFDQPAVEEGKLLARRYLGEMH
jgi:glucose-6-phosphate isomerase